MTSIYLKNSDDLWKDPEYTIKGEWRPYAEGFFRGSKYNHFGILSYSHEKGLELELIHKHGKNELGWGGAKTVLGKVIDGVEKEKVTCTELQLKASSSASTIFRVKYVFRGFHLKSINKKNITLFGFRIKHLHQWLKSPSFTVQNKKGLKGFRVSYSESLGKWKSLGKDLDFRITRHSISPFNRSEFGEVVLKETVKIELQGKKGSPQSFLTYFQYMKYIIDFFSLATLDLANPSEIFLFGNFGHEKIQGIYKRPSYAKMGLTLDTSNQRYEQKKYNILFCEEHLEKKLEFYFKNWINNYKNINTPFALYKSSVYYEEYLEPKFIFMAQSIESYHRFNRIGKYTSDEVYEKTAEELILKIPNTLERSHRESLGNKIKYGNEFSLKKRLAGLINENKSILETYFKFKSSNLAQAITNARNALTHHSSDSLPTSAQLSFYHLVLKTLIELSMLRDIGFNNQRVEEIARNCEKYRHLKYRYNELRQFERIF